MDAPLFCPLSDSSRKPKISAVETCADGFIARDIFGGSEHTDVGQSECDLWFSAAETSQPDLIAPAARTPMVRSEMNLDKVLKREGALIERFLSATEMACASFCGDGNVIPAVESEGRLSELAVCHAVWSGRAASRDDHWWPSMSSDGPAQGYFLSPRDRSLDLPKPTVQSRCREKPGLAIGAHRDGDQVGAEPHGPPKSATGFWKLPSCQQIYRLLAYRPLPRKAARSYLFRLCLLRRGLNIDVRP